MHSEEKLADYVMKTFHFHNIMKQLLTITADNAKNNDLLCQKFHKVLKKKVFSEIINKKQFIACHIHFNSVLTSSIRC